MAGSLIFLLALLAGVVWLNRRLVGGLFGRRTRPCRWSRIAERDRDGRAAWFCPACRREVLTDDGRPPDRCGLDMR